jgi:hypothetical protein
MNMVVNCVDDEVKTYGKHHLLIRLSNYVIEVAMNYSVNKKKRKERQVRGRDNRVNEVVPANKDGRDQYGVDEEL